jgi:putative phosphoesterase
MRAVVLADTHIRDSGSTRLPEPVWEEVRQADVVLHAGDFVCMSFLDQLRSVAPLHAVLGNNDTALIGILAGTVELDLEGARVAIVHDSGPRGGRETRMHRRFPSADVVVFGHSHIPWNAVGVAGQLLFNPGSPTQRRTQPHPTFGLLEIEAGTVRAEIVRAD